MEKLNECQKALDMKAKTIEDILEHIHGEVENAKKRKNDAYAASYYGQLINEKWVFLEDVTALLMKLVQERDDNKLLVIQAVTKLRAKEEQLEGKVLIDRKQLEDLLATEEKNVEYAKLVAGQAEEYAEKMVVVQAKEHSVRKQFQDLFDTIPIEMEKVGRKYEVYSIGTKKQWIAWLVKYAQSFDETLGQETDKSFVLVDRKEIQDKLEEYKKIDKTSSSKLWVEGARWVIEFIEKELLAGFESSNGKGENKKQLQERILEIDKPSNGYGEVCEQNRQYRILLKKLLSGSEGSKVTT